jgi:CRISPR-associated protein Cmr5
MRARSQQQAETIHGLVEQIRRDVRERKDQKRYGALCHRFPLMVRENGLAAAIGFLAAKGTDPAGPESRLLAHYAAVLNCAGGEALRQSCVASSLDEYRRLTRTALQASEWFKRYAEAILKVDASGADTGVQDEEGDHG